MPDRPSTPPGPQEEDFAAMFAASEKAQKAAGTGKRPRLAIGDRVSGKVVSIGQEATIVELAGGGEGTLETLELRDAAGALTVKEGDTVEARVVALGEKQGFVSLRRGALGGLGGAGAGGRGADKAAQLAEAMTTGLPVEGLVTGVNKGGLEVDVAGARAFCPLSQVDLRPVADPAAFVGQRLSFRVTRAEEDRRGLNVVLSRRALLEEEMQARAVATRGKLMVGAVLPGVVTALKDFGAFVDVGGIEGLLPASEISFQRGTKPSDVLTVGQPVTVQVLKVGKRDDARRPEQVSFSLKALERDPWLDAAERLPAGTVTRGQITRTETFGAFVQLAPGVEGLLHIGQLAGDRPLRHARDAVKPGDAMDVVVLAVDTEKRRISLGVPGREETVDDEGRAAAARAAGAGGGAGGAGKGLGTLGDLLKGKLGR